MHGLGDAERGATSRLQQQLKSSRVGQRWERMFRLHAHEIDAVLAVHADVRGDVARALTMLSDGGPVDNETTRAIDRVLDDLQRHASVPLQRDLTRMRDELLLARGHTLQELLVD
jgi:uncharacterized protein (UPF0371 family)